MLILLSCAKTMTGTSKIKAPGGTDPLFSKNAADIAFQMSRFSVEELEKTLHINSKLALENYRRFQYFHSDEAPSLQALLAYTGIVYKRINPGNFTPDDFRYAQKHLRLTSFCYGLLRPLDYIKPYRAEGSIRIPEPDETNLFDYWKPLLTAPFIQAIQEQGGTLVNLASTEMKQLFYWKEVEDAVKIITPEFYVLKNEKPTNIVIYTKMARGEMARFILKNRLSGPQELKAFHWEGFQFDPDMSTQNNYIFTLAH